MKASRKWLVAGICAFLALVAAATLFIGVFGFLEAQNVPRGSLSYYVGIPASVRSLPIVEECRAPVYRRRGRDGESPPFVTVFYQSRSAAQDISATYTEALTRQACKKVQTQLVGEKSVMQFSCHGADLLSASVWVGSETPCRSIELNFIENY